MLCVFLLSSDLATSATDILQPSADRKGGPLALTDANLVLGRILPDFFPKVFGPRENEALDPQASLDAFQALEKRIRAESAFEGSIDELVYGFVTGTFKQIRTCKPHLR